MEMMPDLHNRRLVRADQLKVIQMALRLRQVFQLCVLVLKIRNKELVW